MHTPIKVRIDHYPDPMLNAVIEAINHDIGTFFGLTLNQLAAEIENFNTSYQQISKDAGILINRIKSLYPPQDKHSQEAIARANLKLQEFYIEQCRLAIKIAAIICIFDGTQSQQDYKILAPYFDSQHLSKQYQDAPSTLTTFSF